MVNRKSITLVTETLGRSLLADAGTFGFLLFCIWVSYKIESILWATVLGVITLVVIFARTALATSGEIHYFASTREARNWLDRKLMEETLGMELKPLRLLPPVKAPRDGRVILANFGKGLVPAFWYQVWKQAKESETTEPKDNSPLYYWSTAEQEKVLSNNDSEESETFTHFSQYYRDDSELVGWIPMPSVVKAT